MQSLISGTLPWTHRALALGTQTSHLVAAHGLLPILKQQGYRTLTATANGWASPSNLSIGRYADIQQDATETNLYFVPSGLFAYANSNVIRELAFLPSFQIVSTIAERAGIAARLIPTSGIHDPRRVFNVARTLTKGGFSTPTLLWVHSCGPHAPYAAASPFLRSLDPSTFGLTRLDSSPFWSFEAQSDPNFPERYIGRYDEGVAANDAALGDFLDFLVKQGLYEDALIIITADHGESFGHGYGQHGGPELYEDLIRIPLLIKLPHQHVGQHISLPTQQVDFLATVRAVLGLPADSFIEGHSLLPTIHGAMDSRPIFSMNFEQNLPTSSLTKGTVTMIDWPWKYVHYFGIYQGMSAYRDALYDLEDDQDELNNRVQTEPERAQRMLADIKTQLANHGSALQQYRSN